VVLLALALLREAMRAADMVRALRAGVHLLRALRSQSDWESWLATLISNTLVAGEAQRSDLVAFVESEVESDAGRLVMTTAEMPWSPGDEVRL